MRAKSLSTVATERFAVPGSPAPNGAPATILLCEQELRLLDDYRNALLKHGFEVRDTACGEEAVRFCREQPMDASVLDASIAPLFEKAGCIHTARRQSVPAPPCVLLVDSASWTRFPFDWLSDPGRVVALPKVQDLVHVLAGLVGTLILLRKENQTLQSQLASTRQRTDVVSFATGVLAAQMNLGKDEALRRLRQAARNRRERLATIAHEVAASRELLAEFRARHSGV